MTVSVVTLIMLVVGGFAYALNHSFTIAAQADFQQDLAFGFSKLTSSIEVTVRNQPGSKGKVNGKGKGRRGGPRNRDGLALPPGLAKKQLGPVVNEKRLAVFRDMCPNLGYCVMLTDGTILANTMPTSFDVSAPDRPIEGHQIRSGIGPGRVRLAVAADTQTLETTLQGFQQRLIGLGLLMTVPAVVLAIWLSRRITKPIYEMAESAKQISEDSTLARIQASSAPQELMVLCDSLNAAFERIADAQRRQKRFAANASHELRTPLAVIRSQSELMLAKTRTVQDYQEAMQVCDRAARQLQRLVEGLSQLASGYSTRETASNDGVDLRQVVHETMQLVNPWLIHSNLSMKAEFEPRESSVNVSGDADELCCLVTNLVSNAIQHHTGDGVIQVSLASEDDQVLFTVKDDGPGIPPEKIQEVFEPFYQVDPARTNTAYGQGSGLGLAICRQIVEAHDGDISLTSQPGSGTCVTVRLPR